MSKNLLTLYYVQSGATVLTIVWRATYPRSSRDQLRSRVSEDFTGEGVHVKYIVHVPSNGAVDESYVGPHTLHIQIGDGFAASGWTLVHLEGPRYSFARNSSE